MHINESYYGIQCVCVYVCVCACLQICVTLVPTKSPIANILSSVGKIKCCTTILACSLCTNNQRHVEAIIRMCIAVLVNTS